MADYQHNRVYKTLGFTIVELLVVIAIMGILSAIAYPSMQRQIAQMKVQNAANQLEMSLKQARADAIVYRSNVVVSTSDSAISLTQAGNNNYPQTIAFAEGITPVSSVSVTLTSTKAVLSAPASMGFCYQGVSTDKYVVSVEATSNISTAKSGSCP